MITQDYPRARIHDLIRQVAEQTPDLAREIAREVDVLSERRAFGLNFERHTPEEVELPGRPVRRGDKVHVLPPRGETPKAANSVMWVVESLNPTDGTAVIGRVDPKGTVGTQHVSIADLVVVAEFRDPIYLGLVSTGTVERGGDKPFHSVINGENFHVLQTLLFTHRGKVDAIYIDPPYNTGARDWKYNNDYVESDDQYRHSKWLAFMERRLLLARELLNPEGSVLIVTIDEKEYLRLGLLLAQTFPDAKIQMTTTVIKPEGTGRRNEFSRTNEFIFFAMLGDYRLFPSGDDMVDGSNLEASPSPEGTPIEWRNLRRRERESVRGSRPNQFYAVFVETSTGRIHSVGDALPAGVPAQEVDVPVGCEAYFPISGTGQEMLWSVVPERMRYLYERGFARFNGRIVQFLNSGTVAAIERGEIVTSGRDEHGGVVGLFAEGARTVMPKTLWMKASHNSQASGSLILKALIGERGFPFPKSLYAVEDALRFFVAENPTAVVLDFFSGSGTTGHAVMRLNNQDGGRRTAICVTNNEVSAREQHSLRREGFRPGDPEWEERGICEHITKPRIAAAITGKTPDDVPIRGDYRFTDVFPMADGLNENVEFFTLTYEAPLRVASHRDFPKVAPLLWLRAGASGRRIEALDAGWDVADSYGVLADLDKSDEFVTAVAATPTVRVAFVITDEDRLFEAVAQRLPGDVEPVRMYDAYLRNFELESRVPQ